MPQFRFAISAFLIGACFFSLEISAADISGYRGILLGMSIEQAERKLAGSEGLAHCKPKPSRASGCLEFIERGSPDTNVTIFFRDDKAYLVRLLPQIEKYKIGQERCTALYEATRSSMKERFGKPDITEEFERFGAKIKRSVWLDTGRHLRVSGSWVGASEFCAGVIVDFRNKPYRQRPKI